MSYKILVISIINISLRAVIRNYLSRYPNHDSMIWNIFCYDTIGSNGNVVSDLYLANYLHPRADINTIANNWATFHLSSIGLSNSDT